MTERRWHDDVPGYGRRYHHEVVRGDGSILTTTLIPVLTLARRARTGEAQVYMRRERVVVPGTPEDIAEMETMVAVVLEGMGSSGGRSRRGAEGHDLDEEYP